MRPGPVVTFLRPDFKFFASAKETGSRSFMTNQIHIKKRTGLAMTKFDRAGLKIDLVYLGVTKMCSISHCDSDWDVCYHSCETGCAKYQKITFHVLQTHTESVTRSHPTR